MVNTTKYFALLENLTLKHALPNQNSSKFSAQASHVPNNLRILEKYIQLDVKQQLQELCSALKLCDIKYMEIDLDQATNCYIIRLQYVLRMLMSNINFDSDAKEDLISVAHLKLFIQATQELSYYALRSQLHEDLYKSPVFKDVQYISNSDNSLLLLSVQFFAQLMAVRQMHIANAMEMVLRDLLAAVISLRVGQLSAEELAQTNTVLVYLWEKESKADFFRHVLLLKATPQLCAPLALELHKQLLGKLSLPHGFASLLAALHTTDSTRSLEIVANIVAQRGYSQALQQRLISQIFEFCRLQLTDANIFTAGVLSLRRLYELNEDNRKYIKKILLSHWQPLTAPEDLINGLIIWEHEELCAHIRLWQQLFCSSSVACLPSALLVEYLPLLLQLYEKLPETVAERQVLATLILRCLDNRETMQDLSDLLQRLFSWHLAKNAVWKSLHQRVFINSTETNRCTVKVAQHEPNTEQGQWRVLTPLLMFGSDHALTCKVFLALLSLMMQHLGTSTCQPSATELLSSESELADFLEGRYQLKLEILVALEQLVWHEPLKTQLATSQSKPFIQLVVQLLEQRVALKPKAVPEADQSLVLILLLLQEILERSEQLQLADITQRLKQPLQQLQSNTQHPLIKSAVLPLIGLVNGERPNTRKEGTMAFQQARELIEDQQSHLQVYGIQLMVEALRKKDPAFVSQSHRIIALALTTLKSKESYTFLNCVRLFVALVHIIEGEVLEVLSDEYLSETADVDYRLVVGEAILKSAHEIGPLCYRYKAVLFNCFLRGTRSPVDEFRASAYANLGQLCRLLAYQVHSFFQELLQLINCELSSGRYLPAKRGALYVLSELLAGMESLLDYQDMLLPIYRLLRTIEASEDCDSQMRKHAANGLTIINDKCRELFHSNAVQHLEKDIKVLGIKETDANRKRHILELN